MSKFTDFMLAKKGLNPIKMAPRLKYIGILEIFFAIILGGYHVFKHDAGITATVTPGLIFLIGIITAYCGSFFEQYTLLQRETGGKRD